MSLLAISKRLVSIALLTSAILIASSGLASAETMKTNTETKLYARPGEASKVIKTLEPGARVEVLGTQGRWIRVQVGNEVGWVTRTTVEPLEAVEDEGESKGKGGGTAEWGGKDGKTSGGSARESEKRYVTAKKSGTVRREPVRSATEVYVLLPGDIASVEGESEQGAWLLIENQDGQMGWIRGSRVKTVDDPDAFIRARAVDDGDTGGVTRTVRKERIIAPRVEAGLGYRGLGMDFESNGGGFLDEYTIEASSALTRIGAWVPLEFSGVVIELGGTYAFSIARPGIRYLDQGDISFITHDAYAGASIGYRLLDGLLTLAASGGYHYSIFRTDVVDNVAYLPSERLTGIAVGGYAELAPARGKYTIRAGGRGLIGGARTQTVGLEDGTDSSANAWWANVDVDYALWSAFDLIAGYTFERTSTVWAGPSARQPGATAAKRLDANHLLYFGVGRAF